MLAVAKDFSEMGFVDDDNVSMHYNGSENGFSLYCSEMCKQFS